MSRPLLEICLDSVESAIQAEKAGANRVELCASLVEGGTTPSAGMIALAKKRVNIPVHVMIRPRGGDFCYTEDEFLQMKYDIELCKKLGADGIVLGLLLPDGTIDVARTKALVEVAKPMAVTFHRAFDMTRDPFEALEALISIGSIQRILTSGQEVSAVEGIDLIKQLCLRAAGRIIVMPGGGIHERNINKFIQQLGTPPLTDIHVAADTTLPSKMEYKNPNVYMGIGLFTPEYTLKQTSEERVKQFLSHLH